MEILDDATALPTPPPGEAFLFLSVRRRSGSSAKELAAVGQFDGTAVPDRSSGLCTKTGDFDLSSGFDRIRLPAEPDQGVRRAKFETPVGNGAIRFLDVDVKPGVRIREFDFGNRSV